jgi:hypothetical protein
MATYYGTYGQKVQYLSSDPAVLQTGQVWYNSTSAVLKVRSVTTSGTWASGGNLNTGRTGLAGAGIQTAAIAVAGGTVPTYSTATESYNGSSWTSVNPVNTGRGILGGTGTQGAAFIFSGQLPSTNQTQATEDWNGTSWTNGTNYPLFGYHRGTGTQTAAITLVGQSSPNGDPGAAQTFPAAVNTYNGTSYTSSPSYNTGRRFGGVAGIQTSALYFGGQPPGGSDSTTTELWNGSSWTTVNSLNQSRTGLAGSGSSNSSVLAFGGNNDGPTNYSSTELWNGTSWTANPTGLGTARAFLAGCGTQTLALAFGGSPTGASTEEWTGPGVGLTKTVTVS